MTPSAPTLATNVGIDADPIVDVGQHSRDGRLDWLGHAFIMSSRATTPVSTEGADAITEPPRDRSIPGRVQFTSVAPMCDATACDICSDAKFFRRRCVGARYVTIHLFARLVLLVINSGLISVNKSRLAAFNSF